MHSPFLITNAHLLDSQYPSPVSIRIANGRVDRIVPSEESFEAHRTFDAKGKYVVPGFIDVHLYISWLYGTCSRPAGLSQKLVDR